MDRKWLLGLSAGALAVLIVAIAVVFGGGGGGPVDAARAFFAAIPSGGPQAAYGKAAVAFRSATTPDAWAATVGQYNLSQYSSSSWNEGTGSNGSVATLNGVLNLKGGGVQPATVQMVKGAGGWSVYSLNLPSGGVAGATATAAAGAAPAGVTSAGAINPAGGPVAPSGAAPLQPDAGQAGMSPPSDQSAQASAPPAGPGPQTAYPPAPDQGGAPVTLIPTRVAHDCGPHLLQMPGVQSIDVHCVDGITAVPGTRGQCQAIINGGRPVNVSVVVQSYDPATDDAELDCRLY